MCGQQGAGHEAARDSLSTSQFTTSPPSHVGSVLDMEILTTVPTPSCLQVITEELNAAVVRYLEQLRQWQDRLKEEVDRRNANRPEHAISMVANKRIISGLRRAAEMQAGQRFACSTAHKRLLLAQHVPSFFDIAQTRNVHPTATACVGVNRIPCLVASHPRHSCMRSQLARA